MKTDIVFALIGDIRFNARALKQLRALAELGLHVMAFGVGESPGEFVLDDHIRVRLLETPKGSGPAFFWRAHRLMKEATAPVPARVYHASDLYTLPALAGAARLHGAKLAYDARERYPYVASSAGRPWVTLGWEIVERRGIRRADAVFTVSESIASHLSASYTIPLPAVLYNVPVRRSVERTSILRDRLGIPPDKAIVLHQGKMQKDRGCRLLVDAMRGVEGAVLVFLGDGPLRHSLESYVHAMGLDDRIYFLDAVIPEDLLAYTASADIGVTLLEDTCLNHRYALPNKLFEYLMAGIPVLASDLPEMERIVTTCDVGRVVYPENPEAVGEVLRAMLNAPEQQSKWASNASCVFETFNWEAASEEFKRIYRNLLESRIA